MLGKFFKKLTGLDKIEANVQEAAKKLEELEAAKQAAEAAIAKSQEEEQAAK